MKSLNYCFFSSALTFGFEPSVYSVMEGRSEDVTVTVMNGSLERDVVVTVTSHNGSAGTVVVVGNVSGVDCV